MRHRIPRREFLGAMTALAAFAPFPPTRLLGQEMLYPPMDLSHFDTPLAPAPSEIHFGYASITWGGKDRQAIEDIAAVGFRGIQLRSNSIAEFGSPSAMRDFLTQHELKFVALSSGDLLSDSASAKKSIAEHTAHAKFLRDAGGLYLQVLDNRPKGRVPIADDYNQLGHALPELGHRPPGFGILVGLHNTTETLGEC